MNDLPLVSIAAINYNNSKTVIETLESIRSQTYTNIELIVVDDCSTDNDVELINNWLKSYPGKYKFIQHEKNMGISTTYNSGLKNATGKYFSTVDTDDVILPEKIEKQVQILEASDEKVGAVYSDAYVMDINSIAMEGLFIQRHRQFPQIPSGNIYEALLPGNYIPVMSALIKRNIFESIGLYDEDLYDNDYDMWLRIAKNYDMVFSDFISSRYRIRPGSLTFVITQKEWMYTDAKIYLKHVDAALPIQRLKNLALEAYHTGDEDTMPVVNEIANKINNRYLKTAYLLWHFDIPFTMGEIVLAKKDENIYETPSSGINTDNSSGLTLFTDQIFEALSFESIKEIARNAYCNNHLPSKPLVQAFFERMKHRYFKTILLLWKYKIFVPNGLIILARIDGYCSVQVSNKYIDMCIYKDIFGAIKTGNSFYFRSK